MFCKRILRRIRHIPKFLYEAWKWEYETCTECGTAFRIMWHIKDEIWEKVTGVADGGGGSYCLDCFIKKAEKQGVKINAEDLEMMEPFYPEQ